MTTESKSRVWLNWAASKDAAIEAACRRRIVVAGYEITSERPGWVTARKGDWSVGANTIVELADWIAIRRKKHS